MPARLSSVELTPAGKDCLARLQVFPGFGAALLGTLAVTVRGQERFAQVRPSVCCCCTKALLTSRAITSCRCDKLTAASFLVCRRALGGC